MALTVGVVGGEVVDGATRRPQLRRPLVPIGWWERAAHGL